MKLYSAVALALSSTLVLAAPTPVTEQLFTIETAPGETKQVTEAQKWELHNVSITIAMFFSYAELNSCRLVFTSWISLNILTCTHRRYHAVKPR